MLLVDKCTEFWYAADKTGNLTNPDIPDESEGKDENAPSGSHVKRAFIDSKQSTASSSPNYDTYNRSLVESCRLSV